MPASLSSTLKDHRSAAGLTQEELAEQAEVSARTVSDIERGLRIRIYRDTARRLADALGLTGAERAGFEDAARGPRPRAPDQMLPLPVPPTRLIGRERELEIIVTALDRPEVRLVTLSGPGGIGKTRLALEAAGRAHPRDGAAFVELGTTSDPVQVIRLIARGVGVSGARSPTVQAIAEHLRGRDLLLLLDTFEHVMGAAGDIADLLGMTSGVTILATSREALRIRGEHEVAIPTLDLPAEAEVDTVLAAPATALFIERAREVLPSLSIDLGTAEAISGICTRLSGLPLAIELAAVRVKHLPLSTLHDELEHALDVLVGGPRDLPQRQRTMRDAIAWSYGLLGPSERRSFLDLSVFSGGWSLEAASAVCGINVLHEIGGLIDKSLVVRVDENEPRWDMLDVIGEFAAAMREGSDAERRHLEYFLRHVEEAGIGLGGAGQEAWILRLAREHDNIRAALRRAIGGGHAATALRIGGAIWRFWLLHGDLSEGRGWLRSALELDTAADPHLRSKALWGLAWLAYHQGDHDVVGECADELLRLAERGGDPVEVRNALTIRGIADQADGRLTDALGCFERCVELLRDAGPSWLLATSLLNLGTAAAHAGDTRAHAILEEARDLYLEIGDQRFATRSILYLGYAALGRGDLVTALSSMRESLIAFYELDDLWGTAEALEGIAAVGVNGGGGARTVRLAGAAATLRERLNTRPLPADHAVLERSLERVRPTIDDGTWAASWAAGAAMTLEQAVNEAMHL